MNGCRLESVSTSEENSCYWLQPTLTLWNCRPWLVTHFLIFFRRRRKSGFLMGNFSVFNVGSYFSIFKNHIMHIDMWPNNMHFASGQLVCVCLQVTEQLWHVSHFLKDNTHACSAQLGWAFASCLPDCSFAHVPLYLLKHHSHSKHTAHLLVDSDIFRTFLPASNFLPLGIPVLAKIPFTAYPFPVAHTLKSCPVSLFLSSSPLWRDGHETARERWIQAFQWMWIYVSSSDWGFIWAQNPMQRKLLKKKPQKDAVLFLTCSLCISHFNVHFFSMLKVL